MPLTTTISYNDSEAHSKLFLLLGITELQIEDTVQTISNDRTVITSGICTLLNRDAKVTLAEIKSYSTKSLELNMEVTETGTLADLSNLLQLNPNYNPLYQLLEFSSLRLYARASEGYDFEYLTFEGELLDDDTLLGFIAKETGIKNSLTGLKLAVHISQRAGSIKRNTRVTITAQFALGGQSIDIEIRIPLQQHELWSLRLLPPGVNFNIATLLKLGMDEDTYASMPIQVTSIPDFLLSSLTIDFDPTAATTKLRHINMVLGIGKTATKPWVILGTESKPTVSLQEIGLSLNMYWDRNGEFSYQGIVNGRGAINSFTIEASIPIPLQGVMTLEVSSPDPSQPLPPLTDFSQGLLDENGLTPHLPEGDMTKFTLYLNRLRLAILLDKELSKTTVQEFELDIKSSENGSWVIWKDHLELNEFGLSILLAKQDDIWQTSGTLYGKGHIQETTVALRLQKPVTGPWELVLTEPVEFSLQKVEALTGTNLLTNTNNTLPAKLEPTNNTAFGVRLRKFNLQFQQAEPKFPYLGLYIETKGKLDIIPGKLSLLEVFFALELQSADKDTRKTFIRLGGKITIARHAISLVAQKTNDEKGWEYQGSTEPGDAISLNDLLGALLKPAGVTLPTTLPQLTVRNIDLYYAPTLKQVTFKGETQLKITDTISARFTLNLDSKNGVEEKDQYLIIKGSSYIDISDASFVLTAAYDSRNKEGWRFTGRAYDEIVFTDLLRKMLANTTLALPDVLPVSLTLKKAAFELAPTLKYYKLSGHTELTVQIAETFPLIVTAALTLERPAVKTPDAPAEKWQVELNASAQLQLIPDKAVIKFTGSYSSDKKGWEFSSDVTFDQGLKLGELITASGELFNTRFNIPKILDKEIPLKRAGVSINTASKTFSCYSDFAFTINKQEVAITTRLTLIQNNSKTSTTFLGNIALGKKEAPLLFDLIFDKNPDGSWMLATWSNPADKNEVDLGEFINATWHTDLPSGLTINLNQALLAYHPAPKKDDPSKALFLVSIGNGINLSNLPLIGQFFPPDKTLKLNYQIEYASEAFIKDETGHINELLKNTQSPALNKSTLEKGLGLSVILQIGDTIIPVDLNLGLKKQTLSAKEGEGNDILQPKDGDKDMMAGGLAKWFDVQKKLGPLYFNRIGIGYKDGKLVFMLDASVSALGLTIAFAGLSVATPLTQVKPSFGLNGLGIDFRNEVFGIGGSFLRTHVEEKGADEYDEYDGLAQIEFKKSKKETSWSITAIGSYAYVNGAPSLFVYAVLNYPIGGPAFFFVTGLSAGFGYNRSLVMPKLDKVTEFPLLAEALQGKSMPANADRNLLLQELQVLHQYIPPANGQIFLAIGITFSTFKLMESALLLVASFGSRFELNLLGVSTLVVPGNSKEDPGEKQPSRLANVKLLLKGAFVPSQGFFGIQGVLSADSYILSKDCTLSGGFAFFAWFSGEHKGDFVATVGGYHPHFNVPEHYPKVPRVGFNWKLGESMLIKGDMYFALCAHALMAGGHLEATYESGGLKAWFKLGVDFLVAWKPYHYEAAMYIDIGCSYTFEFCGTQHITVDLGAEVDLWGPDFGGHAELHLWIFSIGVNFGDQAGNAPLPIDWKTFAGSFLPKSNLCNITVKKGLVNKGNDDEHLGVVNPKEFILETDAFIPVKTMHCGEQIEGGNWNTDFGIGSMALAANQLQSSQYISITKTNDAGFKAAEHFKFTSLTKKVPAGLWGTNIKPAVNDAQFIENTLSGVSIQPKNNTVPGNSITIKRDLVKYETSILTNIIHWETEKVATVSTEKDTRALINQDIDEKNAARNELLKVLGVPYVIDLSPNLANDFITAPVVIESYQ